MWGFSESRNSQLLCDAIAHGNVGKYVTGLSCGALITFWLVRMYVYTCMKVHEAVMWGNCNTLQHTATHCSTLQHTICLYIHACKYMTLWCEATATHWNTLQHTATHYMYVCTCMQAHEAVMWDYIRAILVCYSKSENFSIQYNRTHDTVCCSVCHCEAIWELSSHDSHARL